MFNKKRELEKIRLALEALETEKQLLLKEKEELLFIKNKLNDISPKIDISNVYVFREFGISYIVNLYIEHFDYQTRFNKKIKGYKTTLINIFDNSIVHQKKSTYELFREENIFDDAVFYRCMQKKKVFSRWWHPTVRKRCVCLTNIIR